MKLFFSHSILLFFFTDSNVLPLTELKTSETDAAETHSTITSKFMENSQSNLWWVAAPLLLPRC